MVQTFTAPTTARGFAPVLTRFAATGAVQGDGLDLYRFDGVGLVGAPLFSQTLDLTDSFDVFMHVALRPGQVYAFALRDTYSVNAATDGPPGFHDELAGGQMYYCTDPRTCRVTGMLGEDLAHVAVDFSTTAVPSTVPEPATWALMGTGLVALGAVARRRRI